MRQHDVGTRLGRARTPYVRYESRLLHPVFVAKLFYGVNSVAINSIFHGTPQVKPIGLRSGDRGGHDTRSLGTTTEPRPG
jgi:hypothetical protein